MKGSERNKIVINLGCGKTRIPRSIGVDRAKIDNFVDVIHDLEKLPYPFEDNFADEIHCYHVLEHLTQPIKKLEEIHRILKPGGKLYLRVPHFSSMMAFTDLTHLRPFGYASFNCFEKNSCHNFYTNIRFRIVSNKIKYFGFYPNNGVYEKYIQPNRYSFPVRLFVRLVNSLINLSPTFFERFWCYYVGGASEISLILEKIEASQGAPRGKRGYNLEKYSD